MKNNYMNKFDNNKYHVNINLKERNESNKEISLSPENFKLLVKIKNI